MRIVNSIKVFRNYKYLLQQLVIRDFKVKYKRSVLGVLWSVLNPLLTMIILNLVFSNLFGMGKAKGIPDYPVYLLTGLVLFNYFSEATSLSMGAVVGNFNLLTKVYIPKYIFPLSKVISSAVNLLFSLVALYMIVAVEVLTTHKIGFYWANIFLPYDLVCMIIFTVGLGMVLSSLTVFFRDMFYIWGVVLTAWNYLTPIMYPISMIENSTAWYVKYLLVLMKINPLYQFVNYARTVVLHGAIPTPFQSFAVIFWALLMLVIGLLFFRSKQDRFIYYI